MIKLSIIEVSLTRKAFCDFSIEYNFSDHLYLLLDLNGVFQLIFLLTNAVKPAEFSLQKCETIRMLE